MTQFLRELFRFFRKREMPRPAAKPVPFEAKFMLFGIGNAGVEYAHTRHNIGFMVVDRCLLLCQDLRKTATVAGAEIATGEFSGKKVAFVKPTTYVNRCGPAFEASAAAFGVPLGSCLVVVDDYNLPIGTVRFRAGGSDGGHNGLKSIFERVGRDFPRLRIGIGPMPAGAKAVDFVLGTFTGKDQEVLTPAIDKAVEGITAFLNDGIEKAMSVFNGPQGVTGKK